MTIFTLFNVGAFVATSAAVLHLNLAAFLDKNGKLASIAILVGVLLLIWGGIQLTGRGAGRIECLRKENDTARRHMERKLLTYRWGSFILFVLSGLVLGLSR